MTVDPGALPERESTVNDAVSMVFFPAQAGGFDLDWARDALTAQGLSVDAQPGALAVRWDEDGPILRVTYAQGEQVAREALQRAGEGAPAEALLRACTARFEIAIDDLDEVLDEMNTLIEVQSTLQDSTGGHLFNTWNREWSA